MMKIVRCVLAGLLVSAVSSCADDVLVQGDGTKVEEGVPMSVRFNFQVEKTAVQTRAAQSTNTEYKVNNLYVFAFNGDGTLDAKRLYRLSELENTTEKQDNGTGTTQGNVPDFRMTSGNGKTFYAVANVGYSGLHSSAFDNVQTLSDLKAVTSDLPESTSLDRTFFVMSGQLDNDGQTAFNVPPGATSVAGIFWLKRTDARITFKVQSNPADRDWTNFSFEPRSYRVVNIPRRTYILPGDEDASGEYGRMTQTLGFDETDAGGISTFDFYLQENRQKPKQQITDEALTGENKNATLFAMREEWTSEDEETGEKIFEFAPEHGTYVEIKGLLSYEETQSDGSTQFVSADVTYTIHLGNTGTSAEADSKANNYNTLRNTHYTYNVTVTGVESITVEVESDEHEETRPGAEGEVVIAGGEVVELDSHFDRYKFYLRRSDLEEQSPEGVLTWAISTPFESAMRVQGGEELPHDYKWITFAINQEYGVENLDNRGRLTNEYVKYPGDFAYDGYDGSTPSETGTYVTPAWNGFHSNRGDGKVVLRDVEQLLNYLTEEARTNPNSELFERYNGEYVVFVTAFIDEFLYVANPVNPNGSTPTNPTSEGLLLWKKVVNGRDRMLHICRGAGQTSPDGNSSVIRSVLSFRQHPIHTIYDVSQPDDVLERAWGTEMIMETGVMAASFEHSRYHNERYTNSSSNGRTNQLNFVTDTRKAWTDIIKTDERYGLNSGSGYGSTNYNTIWHACMLRNRDINGNNVIEESEVRWYLASINQLSALWIGDAAINESARTYPPEAEGTRYHIASSTYWNGDDGSSENPTVLWAEEGASLGDYNYSTSFNETSTDYAYRCVRNLGIDLNASVADNEPQDYWRLVGDGTTVDLSRLGYAAKRTASDGGNTLPDHDERNTNNRPYEQFHLSDELYSTYESEWDEDERDWITAFTWKDFHYRLYPDRGYSSNPCPDGYRLPNQRELAIMLSIPSIKQQLDAQNPNAIITGTSFSMDGIEMYVGEDRPGFLYRTDTGAYILETAESNKGGTRCIRDVVE